MDLSATRAASSGPQRTPPRAFTAAELNKLNKAELNRERNKLLAQIEKIAHNLSLAESVLREERDQHEVTKEDMNEFIVDIYYRDQERSRSEARALAASTPASTSHAAEPSTLLIERPEVVKIRILKRILGISDSEHKRILRNMHLVFHNCRLNPSKRWSRQNPDNVSAYMQAMDGVCSCLAKAHDRWASAFLAQQYCQNWRKTDKVRRTVDDDGLSDEGSEG